MAFVIDKDICIGCGTCEEECPVGSISVDEDGKYVIDPETCIDCGSCAAVCPVDAVKE
ncbi:MAG: 4Fe-4S binding protein [Eubacteriales bacterium]